MAYTCVHTHMHTYMHLLIMWWSCDDHVTVMWRSCDDHVIALTTTCPSLFFSLFRLGRTRLVWRCSEIWYLERKWLVTMATTFLETTMWTVNVKLARGVCMCVYVCVCVCVCVCMSQRLLISLPLRRGTGAFSYKRSGEGRQSSAISDSMKYSLRDTEKRLKRQQSLRTNGEEGGWWEEEEVCEMRQKCEIQLWSREWLLVVCEPSIASLSRSSFCLLAGCYFQIWKEKLGPF